MQDKKDLAKLLYVNNGMSQKEVAQRVDVAKNTVSNWVTSEGWETMRKSLLVTRSEQLRNLIDQLSELNAFIKAKPDGQRWADKGQGDTLIKYTAAIKNLTTDAGLNETLEVCTLLIGFVQKNFPDKLNATIPMIDAFVKQYL